MQTFRFLRTVVGPIALLAAAQTGATTITMAKSPYCGCCGEWAKQMRSAGFTVKVINVDDPAAISAKLGVPGELRACHTAKVRRYVIEGHVPAGDVKALLKAQPEAVGLAVPGMPAGSPGMDQGGMTGSYTTLLFTKSRVRVFASH
jgi:hypothetical protein